MRKGTLNQTWTLCLRMWQWVSKEWLKGEFDVIALKELWLENNGFNPDSVCSNCFFCDYVNSCVECPGRLIDSFFHCSNKDYHYEEKPVEFYAELLRLNRIRKAKK